MNALAVRRAQVVFAWQLCRFCEVEYRGTLRQCCDDCYAGLYADVLHVPFHPEAPPATPLDAEGFLWACQAVGVEPHVWVSPTRQTSRGRQLVVAYLMRCGYGVKQIAEAVCWPREAIASLIKQSRVNGMDTKPEKQRGAA